LTQTSRRLEAFLFETKKPAFLLGLVGLFAADSDFFICGN
jgi:hypothetical protein